MKTALIAALLAFVAATSAHAKDEKLPKIPEDKMDLEGGGKRWSVFTIEDAKKEALKKKQPIAFVVTDERAEEAAVKAAGPVAFWGLQKECTMVLLPSTTAGQWKDRLPPAAFAALAAAGKEMPKAVVIDQTASAAIGTMQANQIIDGGEKAVKEFTKLMKETNKDPKKVAEAAAAKPAAAAPAPAAPATAAAAPAGPAATPPAAAGPVAIKGAQPEAWTSAQGTKIQATLLEVSGDSATLLMADGRKLPVPVSSLSPESQKRIEELKAASAK
jgi:hypothetical protein